MKSLALVGLAAAAIGCAPPARYACPALITPTDVADGVSTYRLADGEVRIALLPMVQLPSLWIGQWATRALHVRATFANRGLRTWRVYPRQQLARVGEGHAIPPTAAMADPVEIAPGQSHSLDLFFPAPGPKSGPQLPSRIALDWRIDEAGLMVAGETAIDPVVALATVARSRARGFQAETTFAAAAR
jgi:hypothetical protein